MKISYTDNQGVLLLEVQLDDEEIKTLESDMVSIIEWHVNAISEKIRRQRDALVKEHVSKLSDAESETILSGVNPKQLLADSKFWPVALKKEIVRKAKFDSALERNIKNEKEFKKDALPGEAVKTPKGG